MCVSSHVTSSFQLIIGIKTPHGFHGEGRDDTTLSLAGTSLTLQRRIELSVYAYEKKGHLSWPNKERSESSQLFFFTLHVVVNFELL